MMRFSTEDGPPEFQIGNVANGLSTLLFPFPAGEAWQVKAYRDPWPEESPMLPVDTDTESES